MRSARSSRLVVTGIAAICISALAACGGGSDEGSEPKTTSTSASPNDDGEARNRSLGFAQFESFSGDDSPMPNYDDGSSFGRIQDGSYHLGVYAAGASTRAGFGREDFGSRSVVEVEASDVGAATDAAFGVVCRMSDDGTAYYRFGVGYDGTYSIARVIDGEATILTGDGEWVEHDDLEAGLDQYDVTASCIGPRLALEVNDVVLAEVRDTKLDRGNVGVFVQSFDEAEAEVAFANFTATKLPEITGNVTQAAVDAWQEFFVRTPIEVSRCDLLDPDGGATKDPLFRTSCEGVSYERHRSGDEVDDGFEAVTDMIDAGLVPVDGFPDCRARTEIIGTFSPAGAPPGKIACAQDGDAVVIVWSDHDRLVVGLARTAADEPDYQANFGPAWWPLVPSDATGT